MDNNLHKDIQHAVLSTFLFANDTGDDLNKVFMLDTEVFTTPLTKRVAEVINEETNGDKMYGYQCVTMEDSIKGTKHELEWLEILSQTPIPLTVAKRFYDDLVKKMKQRIAMGVN